MNEYPGIPPVSSVSPVRNNETADPAPVKTGTPFQLEDAPTATTRKNNTPDPRRNVEQNPEENTDDSKAAKSNQRVNSKSEKTSQSDSNSHDESASAGQLAVTAEPLMLLNSSVNISLTGIIVTDTESKDGADNKAAVNTKAAATKSAQLTDTQQQSPRQAIVQDIPDRQAQKRAAASNKKTEATDDTPSASESRPQPSAVSAKTHSLDQETAAKAVDNNNTPTRNTYSADNPKSAAAAESVKPTVAYGTERGQEQSQGRNLPLEGVKILAADKYQLENNPRPVSRTSLLDQLNNKVPANVTRNCRVQTQTPEQHHDSGSDSPANQGKPSLANTTDITMPKNAAQEKNSTANTKNSQNTPNEAFATLTQNVRNNSFGENNLQQSAAVNTPAGNAATFERVDNIQQLIDRMQPALQNLQSNKDCGLSLKLEIDNIGKMQLFLEQKGAALKVVFEPGSDSCRQELMNQRDSLSQQLRDMGYSQLSLDISSGRDQQRENSNSRQQFGNEELDNVKLAGNSRQDLLAILNMQ